MLASYNWLKELCPGLTLSAKEVAQKLTGAGLEVESMKDYGAPASCIVAEVKSIRPHPSKSGLRLVTVDNGGGTQEVVCGAPNVPEPGGLVVLAPLGTHLPAKDMTIARREIGGVASEGMLCSESELGLSEESDGIIVLANGKAGQKFEELFPRDVIFEIGLTPNRPDALGHLGIARELAALCNLPWKSPNVVEPDGKRQIDELGVKIDIEDGERCPIYAAAGVVDVTIAHSPSHVRYRLESLGVRAISNVVDVTNLVMLETGHPMHAFDFQHVHSAHIVVRRAKQGESMKTLDGVDHALVPDDLLICDARGPVAVAGVMGGANSEIGKGTQKVLFECAYFDARGVRRTAKRHGLHTESSHRFERGVDWDDWAYVLARAVELTVKLSPGAHGLAGHLVKHGKKLERPTIRLRKHKMDALLGVAVPMAEAIATLERLGCVTKSKSDDEATFIAPSHRPDFAREVDLIDEVMRTRGIDNVPTVLPAVRATRDVGGREALASRVREAAVSLGLSEAVTFAFTTREAHAQSKSLAPSVSLKNPLSELQAVMRTSLLPGLLEAVSRARRHGEKSARLFTIGSTYHAHGSGLPNEVARFAAISCGDAPAWLSKPRAVDVWDALGIAREMVERVTGAPCELVPMRGDNPLEMPAGYAHLHPRGAVAIHVQNTTIGRAGPIHPDVAEAFELPLETVLVEIDLEGLALRTTVRATGVPRFPANTRDLSITVPDDVLAGNVAKSVRAAAGDLAEDVVIFDRFTGGQIPEHHVSFTFRVIYRHKDRTLTDAEVDTAHARVMTEVNARFGATLRA